MSVLSDAQFANRVNERGASRRVTNGVEAPAKGYYVSTPDSERRIHGDVTAAQVNDHLRTLTGGYQGGWRSGNSVYLDHSVNVPHLSSALVLGHHWKQRSVYDADNDTYHSERKSGPRSSSLLTGRKAKA